MYTEQELINALMKAHEAGDAESATLLVREIDNRRATPIEQPPVEQTPVEAPVEKAPIDGRSDEAIIGSVKQGIRGAKAAGHAIATYALQKDEERAAQFDRTPSLSKILGEKKEHERGIAKESLEQALGYQNPALKGVSEAKTLTDSLKRFSKDPLEATVHAIASNAPQLAVSVVTAVVTRNPTVTAAVAGLTGGAQEFGNSLLNYAAENGVNITNQAAVRAFFEDPAVLDKATEYAAKRGLATAAGEAVFGTILTKAMKPIPMGSSRVAHSAKTALEASLAGGATETVAQKLVGEDKPGEVVVEAIAGGGVATGVSMVGGRKADTPAPKKPPANVLDNLRKVPEKRVPENLAATAGMERRTPTNLAADAGTVTGEQLPLFPGDSQPQPIQQPAEPAPHRERQPGQLSLFDTPKRDPVDYDPAQDPGYLDSLGTTDPNGTSDAIWQARMAELDGVRPQHVVTTAEAEQNLLNKAGPEQTEVPQTTPEIPGSREAIQTFINDSEGRNIDFNTPRMEAYLDILSKYLTKEDLDRIAQEADPSEPSMTRGALLSELLDERSNSNWENEFVARQNQLTSKGAVRERARTARSRQLAKADALDGMADNRDLTADELSEAMMNKLFAPVENPAPVDEAPKVEYNRRRPQEKEANRKDFIETLIKGKRNANRNQELSGVLRAVIEGAKEMPAHFKVIYQVVLGSIELLESFGIRTKVDFIPADQFRELYGKGTLGVAEFKAPNANRPNGAIHISLKYETDTDLVDGMTVTTLLHEAIHAATHGLIERVVSRKTTDKKLISAVAKLETLRRTVSSDHFFDKTGSATRESFFENVSEFLAYGLTEPTFQIYLRKTKEPRNQLRRKWDAFVEAVMDLLGITKDSHVSMYETILQSFDEILHVQANSPESVKSLLNSYFKDPDLLFAHESFNDILSPEMMTSLREAAEAKFHRLNPDQYVSPYGALADVLKGNMPEGIIFHGMDEGELFEGKTPQQPNGNLDAPYVLMIHPMRLGYYVVSNVPDGSVYLALKERFPGYTVMTPSEAESFLAANKTKDERRQEIVKAQSNTAVEEALGDMFRAIPEKGKQLLQPFMDVHDAETAMLMQAEFGKDMPTNLADFIVGGPNAQAIIHNNPLLRFARHIVHNIVRAQSHMARHVIHPMSQVWFKMSEEDRILAMEIAVEQDARQDDFTVTELHNAGASSEVIQILQMMRRAYDESLAHWNSERQRLGLDPVPRREGYFPSLFFGDYRMIVRDPTGEVVGLVTAGSELGLSSKKKKIQEKFPDYTFDSTIRIGMERKNPYSESSWSFLEALTNFAKNPNAQAAITADFAEFLQTLSVDDARNVLGFSRHEKYKKGIWGSQGRDITLDRGENAHAAFQAMITYLEDGANHHAQMGALKDLATIVTDPTMRRKAPHTVQYLEDLYQHISRRKSPTGNESRQGAVYHNIGRGIDTIIDGALKLIGVGPNEYRKSQALLRSIFSSNVMGFLNLPFTMLQIAQVVQCGPQAASYLRKATGLGIASPKSRLASAEATVAVTRLFMDYLSQRAVGNPITGYEWFGGDQDTKDALNYAMENNLITLNDLELAHTAMLTPFQRKADQIININQRAAEAATRPMVFMWMYNILKGTNLPKATQHEVARNLTNFVMAEYHSTARPMVYQATGTTGPMLGQLKTFAHSYTGQQVFWAKEAFKGNAVGPFIAMMVAYMLYVGVDDMPIYDELDTILRLTTRGLKAAGANVEETGYKEYITPYLPDMLKYGAASHYTGIDFQKRLRMPPLIQDEALANLPALNWFTQVTGDHIDLVIESAKKGEIDDARLKKAQHSAAPSSIKGPLEHFFFKDDDGAEFTKDLMGRWTHRNERDWTLRWMGLRSLEDTLRKEMVSGTKAKIKEVNERKQEIARLYTEAMIVDGRIPVDRFHALRGEYISLGGDAKTLDEKVKKAKERLAKGETLHTLETEPTERTWFFYEKSRR